MFNEARNEVACFMRRLYNQRLTTCSGGNISFRADSSHIVITPSSLDKGLITAEQIGILSLDGRNQTPELKPSIETEMHLSIYRRRKDVQAIVHAHPPLSSSFAATGKMINTRLLAESWMVLGAPRVAPYALMGTQALAESVASTLDGCNVILMENHGALTVGKSLLQAFDRMEVLEAAARITLTTQTLGLVRELTAAQLAAIDAMM